MVGSASPSGDWTRRLIFPATWVAGSLFVLILSGLSLPGEPATDAVSDTYYLVVHAHYVVSLATAFGVFAVVYGTMETILDLRFRRLLGWSQFALMVLGASLIFAPSLLLRLNALPSRYEDQEPTFAMFNGISMVGYAMTLGSVVLFVAVIADIVVRRLQRKQPDTG
jgi:cytochrome c oxidase subunit 1